MKGASHRFMIGGTVPGYDSWEEAVARFPATPIADETAGHDMLYSSGTTGRPKGVMPVVEKQAIDFDNPLLAISRKLYGIDSDTVYLSPAPLYHAAPLRFNMSVMRLGGTSVIMEHFDAEEYLSLIPKHRITHTQVVPTMFVRFLKLPPEVRAKYDVSSLKCAIHAAAPCPIPTKEAMIDWWGPIIWEYYGGTEGNGLTMCNSQEWMAHKGTVGRAIVGKLRICDDEGNELPVGESGTVYFAEGRPFEYHNDPKKTAESRHPKVMDCAVFGVPNADFGEEVKAVVQPRDMAEAGPALAEELIAYCKQHLSAIKCPRSIDFEEELPRHPTGKLYKRLLRDRYWGDKKSRIV